eukprot:TRINITY_DN15521_c0_g1_i1.p1 TRINITY_DN15521_c0_g1~~TRINITY_DN15521_c0_g1_i1.p1  ORF type:complete len:568 (+),score=172.07 TRINITY_DN15521_c0_g1_i1:111-1814(+)
MGPRLDEIKLEDVDFDSVSACRDKHVIKRYIQLLENDGSYFKDLLNACKEKLLELAPKEYWLMYPKQASDQEVLDAKADLLEWENSVNEIDRSLQDGRKHQIFDVVSEGVQAPIRGQEPAVARPHLQKPEKDRPAPERERDGYARDKTKMKDYYSAWDKIDVDAIEDEMEEDERQEREAQKKHFEDLKAEQDDAHRVTPVSTSASKVPSAHRKHMADTEKEKGNEAFYAKDFEEAEAYYTRSLQFKADDPSTWANRALVRLKLQRAEGALEDCEHSLALNPRYMKALHRKGKALHDLGRFEDAVRSFQLALAESPGNTQINGDLAVARRKLRTEPSSAPAPGGPRIEELDPVTNLPLGSAAPKKAPPVRANYTRVAIEEDSDSESEEEVPVKLSSGQGFRKVVIEEVSESEDEDEEPSASIAGTAPSAPSAGSPKKSPSSGFRKVVIEDTDTEDELDGSSGAGAELPDFIQAATYRGRKEGYVFTTRNGKTGYYLDSHGPRREAAATQPAQKPTAKAAVAPAVAQPAKPPAPKPAHHFEPPARTQAVAKSEAPPPEEPDAVSFDDMD